MRGGLLLVFCALAVPSAQAERVVWTAKGWVTEVTGASLGEVGVAVDDEVEIEFSYNDGATGTAFFGFPPGHNSFDFRNNIELAMEVQIGESTWAGSISTDDGGMPRTLEVTDVATFPASPEQLSPALSSKDGEVFSSFPGASGTGSNELEVSLFDGRSPYNFIKGLAEIEVPEGELTPPDQPMPSADTFDLCEVTFGDGEVRAGTDRIKFVIDLATLRVGDGTPPGPAGGLDVAIKRVGFDFQLDWEATVGKCYRIQSSEDLKIWTEVGRVVAESEEETYTVVPFGDPPAQYYRITQTD